MCPRRRTTLYHIMTPDPITVTPDDDLADAYELMLRNDVRRLPVVDDDGELVGILTRSDVQQLIPVHDYDSDRFEAELALVGTLVREVMSWDPVTAAPDETLQDAAERMHEFRVSGLPIVNGRELVGIITESDIFRLVVETWSRDDDSTE